MTSQLPGLILPSFEIINASGVGKAVGAALSAVCTVGSRGTYTSAQLRVNLQVAPVDSLTTRPGGATSPLPKYPHHHHYHSHHHHHHQIATSQSPSSKPTIAAPARTCFSSAEVSYHHDDTLLHGGAPISPRTEFSSVNPAGTISTFHPPTAKYDAALPQSRCPAASSPTLASVGVVMRRFPSVLATLSDSASTSILGQVQGPPGRGPMADLLTAATATTTSATTTTVTSAAGGPPLVGRLPLRSESLTATARHQAASPTLGVVPYRTYYNMSASLRADIQEAAIKKQTGVSLKYLLDFGAQPLERQMLLSARFLHSEIPIRLAHRLMDLNHLPPALSNEPHVRRVKGWYAASFTDFRSFPPVRDNMDVVRFTAMLKNAFRRHNNVVAAVAKGVEEYKRALLESGDSSQERESEIQHFLDTFFLSRIAIRFLAGHHIAMFEPPRPDHIGLVDTRCSPYMVASDAVSEARAICFREYGGAPQVTVLGNTGLTMAYVPSHLHHMTFELVKNSLRAVQERFIDSESEPPPIQVVVAEGLEDVTIKVSDQGGGIPRSGLSRIWTYLYTTARSPLPDVDIDTVHMPAVMAGYGCGLPLSRLYARYFGGDLQMISMEGYGTDVYLHLNRLGNDEEPLPGAV